MKIFSMVFAFLVSLIGAITDLKSGKVKNRHLLLTFCIWLAVWIIALSTGVPFPFTIATGVNFLFAVAAAVILYLRDIWAPGDAKLFVFVAAVFPIDCYFCRDGNVFPSLNIMIYSFAFGYIVLFIQALFDKKKTSITESGKWLFPFTKEWFASVAANMGLVSLICFLSARYAGTFYTANRSFVILTTALLIALLQKWKPLIKTLTGLLGFLVYLFILLRSNSGQTGLFLLQAFLVAVLIELLNRKMAHSNYREINGTEITAGMILSYGTILCMKKCIDPDLPRTTTEDRRSRLSQAQAEAVQRWCKNAKRTAVIVETIPFAPFIAAATLLEILKYFIFMRLK